MAFNLHVTYHCKPGMRETYLNEIKAKGLRDLILQEDGCITYDYYLSVQDPDMILLMEVWASAEQQKVHMTQPHMKDLAALKAAYVNETILKPFEE